MVRGVDWLARALWTTLGAVVLLAAAAVLIGRVFDLSWVGAVALYFVVWWLALFAILPVRIRTQSDLGAITEGTEPGAPAEPALRERAIWTSIAATLVFGVLSVLFPLAGL